MSRLLCIALFLATLPVSLAFQNEQGTPIYRVTSSRVVFEFIAIDKKGRIITDLDKKEVEVLVDGKKQSLDFLVRPQERTGAGYLTVGQLSSREDPGTEESRSPKTESGRVEPVRTTILLDTRALDSSNFARSVAAIRLFVENSLGTDSPIMLAEIDRGLKLILPFTTDGKAIDEALASLKPASVYNPLAPEKLQTLTGEYFDELQKQILYLREGLTLLCYSLSGSPGRKHVVFFSEGYPINPLREVDRGTRHTGLGGAELADTASLRDPGVLPMLRDVVSLANTFGIRFYTIDARGLIAVPAVGSADVSGDFAAGPGEPIEERVANAKLGAASETGATEIQVTNFMLTHLSSLDDARNALLALAGGTNGSAFFNSNDLGGVLRASTAEPGYSYMGSFVPKLKGKPKFRRLKVRSKRKDVIIRHQTGFTEKSDNQLLVSQLSTAFAYPDFFKSVEPVLEISRDQGSTNVILGLPGDQVSARPRGEQFQIELFFAGQVFDEGGKAVSKDLAIQRGFQMDLSGEQFLSLNEQPVLARDQLDLPAGKYRLVLVAVDRISGGVGTKVREFSVH